MEQRKRYSYALFVSSCRPGILGRLIAAVLQVNIQLSTAQVRQLKERVELAGRHLKRLVEETKRNEDRLCYMRRRQKTLETDLQRRLEIEKSGSPDVDKAVLQELEQPLDYEVETAQQFQTRMAHVRSLMSELLARTIKNEWAAHTEMAEQENEMAAKIKDACEARKMLREVLLESKQNAENAMSERKKLYEELQRLETELEVCTAETWLAITERNRLSDHLAILSKKPQITQCERALRAMKQQEKDFSDTENYVNLQLEAKPRKRSIPIISVSSETTRIKGASISSSSSLASKSHRAESSQSSSVASGSRTSEQANVNQDIILPVNIIATIQKAIRDSMGLDVKFD